MRLFVIRHGESSNNFLNDAYPYDAYTAQRAPDPELTQLGWRQANAVATHLATATVAEDHQAVLQEPAAGGTFLWQPQSSREHDRSSRHDESRNGISLSRLSLAP